MKAARSLNVFLILVFLVNLMVLSVAVVPDYCQPPLNRSDCKLKPTPVFYYYKPGSRCEMALWRGCPTLNLFPDQYQCVDFCIYKMFKNRIEDNTAFDTKNSEYSCRDYLNTNKCSNKEESVYTYDLSIESCVQATWRGCPTVNKFPDEPTCQKYCEPVYQDNYDEWREELDAMSEKDTESLNQLLDNVIEDEDLVNPQKLKATDPSIFEDDITEKRITITTVATEGSTAKTLDTSTELKTVATSEATAIPTTESTTELKIVATSEATKPTTESTTELKTVATSEATAKPTTESTTELKTVATSEATTKPTTESTTELKTVATSEATKPTTESTTELKTVATSEATAKPTTESTTELKTVPTSEATKPTTESTTELKTVATSEATKPTTESTTKPRITDLPDEIQNIDYEI